MATLDDEYPRWTVHYNIVNSSRWIGRGWEFFDEAEEAAQVANKRTEEGHSVSIRPFHPNDIPNMGAVHRPSLKESIPRTQGKLTLRRKS